LRALYLFGKVRRMDMKTFLRQASDDERERLATAVKSSVGYFYLIAGGHRRPSTDLCKRLVSAEPKLSLEGLRPDVWGTALDEPSTSSSDQPSGEVSNPQSQPQ
jgi:hypothetical protein